MADRPARSRTQSPRGRGDDLRNELVDAAREMLLTSHDVTPFSLRAVARAVGVSPTAVYRHFDSAADLVQAVLADQNDALREALRSGDSRPEDVSVVEIGKRYARWGLVNPGAYQLLFESADRLGHRGGPGTYGWDMIETLAGLLAARAQLDQPGATVLAIRVWASLHGLISLRLHKPVLPWPTTVDQEVTAIIAALLPGIG